MNALWRQDHSERRIFWLAFWITLAVKFVVAAWLPVTGDEAYFTIWGRDLAWGYYDHTPVVGWILAALMKLGSAPWLIRLPSVLLFSAIAIGIVRLLRSQDERIAYLIATLYVISPVNILGVLITTDIPLIFFSFLSVYFLVKWTRDNRLIDCLWSGLFLGLAFYSKYFAVLLGLGYFVFFALQLSRSRRDGRSAGRVLTGALVVYLLVLPFAAANIYWNYTHCWYNVMFNLVTRNAGETASLRKVLIYLACQLYLITPPVLLQLIRARGSVRAALRRSETLLYQCSFLVPMAAFAALSVDKIIGLHWVLSFYPFLYLLLANVTRERLIGLVNFMAGFSLVHLLILLVLAVLPLKLWEHVVPHYESVVMTVRIDDLTRVMHGYEQRGFHTASDGFSLAALLGYRDHSNVAVFGEGSFHGRQDDMETDYRRFDRGNIVIVTKGRPELNLYLPFFDRVVVNAVMVEGARFNFIEGYGFRYPVYRERVLAPVNARYYAFPWYLPCRSCAFKENYGFDWRR